MRETRTIGKTFTAKINVYNKCKYIASAEEIECKAFTYPNIKNWEIVSGEDATEIESYTDGSCIDDLHEYLVLNFENGETATFRNSYVDMFVG